MRPTPILNPDSKNIIIEARENGSFARAEEVWPHQSDQTRVNCTKRLDSLETRVA